MAGVDVVSIHMAGTDHPVGVMVFFVGVSSCGYSSYRLGGAWIYRIPSEIPWEGPQGQLLA